MYPEEFYEFEHMLEGLDEEIVLMVLGILGIVAVVVGIVALVGYVLQSVGLYTIAKNRGIQNPWLAWLPIGNYWIAGSIADQYQYVVNGQVKNRRKILLALGIAGMVISSLVSSMATGSFVLTTGEVNLEALAELGAVGTLLNLVTSALEIAVFVFWQICLYDYYRSCNPNNAVLFLVLGIVFGFLVPFFIFACRKKDGGMPPRREIPQEPAWQPGEPVREPWELN